MGFEAFKSKLSSFAKDAVDMGKDVAQTTKINFEISSANEKIKDVHCRIGKYVSENNLLTDNSSISAMHAEIFELNSKIFELNETLRAMKEEKAAPAVEAPAATEPAPVVEAAAPAETTTEG